MNVNVLSLGIIYRDVVWYDQPLKYILKSFYINWSNYLSD